MSIQVAVGSAVPLTLQLPDGATDKYVQAVVRDPAGDELDDSPVNLAHVGEGLYTDDSVSMTSDNFVTVTYLVYSDAGYTTLDDDYSHGFDIVQNQAGGGGGGGDVIIPSILVLRSDTNLSTNRLIIRTYIGGVLADVDGGVWLQDSADVYGIKETVSGDSLVASGTACPNTGTGTYEYNFGNEAGYDPELAYTYAVRVQHDSQDIYIDDQSIPAIVSIGVDTCAIRIDTTMLTGIPRSGVEVKANVYTPPEIIDTGSGKIGVMVDVITDETDVLGVVTLNLLRGAEAVISCDDLDGEWRIEVPDQDSANLFDLEEIT